MARIRAEKREALVNVLEQSNLTQEQRDLVMQYAEADRRSDRREETARLQAMLEQYVNNAPTYSEYKEWQSERLELVKELDRIKDAKETVQESIKDMDQQVEHLNRSLGQYTRYYNEQVNAGNEEQAQEYAEKIDAIKGEIADIQKSLHAEKSALDDLAYEEIVYGAMHAMAASKEDQMKAIEWNKEHKGFRDTLLYEYDQLGEKVGHFSQSLKDMRQHANNRKNLSRDAKDLRTDVFEKAIHKFRAFSAKREMAAMNRARQRSQRAQEKLIRAMTTPKPTKAQLGLQKALEKFGVNYEVPEEKRPSYDEAKKMAQASTGIKGWYHRMLAHTAQTYSDRATTHENQAKKDLNHIKASLNRRRLEINLVLQKAFTQAGMEGKTPQEILAEKFGTHHNGSVARSINELYAGLQDTQFDLDIHDKDTFKFLLDNDMMQLQKFDLKEMEQLTKDLAERAIEQTGKSFEELTLDDLEAAMTDQEFETLFGEARDVDEVEEELDLDDGRDIE